MAVSLPLIRYQMINLKFGLLASEIYRCIKRRVLHGGEIPSEAAISETDRPAWRLY